MIWSGDLTLGIMHIDRQHERICRFADLLQMAKKDRTVARLALDFMFDHMAEHFVDEEDLMNTVDYPDRLHHQRLHIQGFDRFVQLRAQFLAGKVTSEHIAESFHGWVEHHILGADKELAEFVRGSPNV